MDCILKVRLLLVVRDAVAALPLAQPVTDNGRARCAIFIACNCPITFYKTSHTDTTETRVSATFTITVEFDRTSRYLGDHLPSRISTARL
jgi:hypothetical protein